MKVRVLHQESDLIFCHPDDVLSVCMAKLRGVDIKPEEHMTPGLALAVNREQWEKDLKIGPLSLISKD